MSKVETIKVAQYLVAKNGTTRYIKFSTHDKASKEEKDLVAKIVAALGGDILYINMTDDQFRQKYNVPDFVKGTISAPKPESKSGATGSDDEVNF